VSYEDAVRIDDCHIDLIYGLIVSQKPSSILELGFGSGRSAKRICDAIEHNRNRPTFKLVDNWMDFDRKIPSNIKDIEFRDYNNIFIVTAEESDFIASCTETFDFILSDADHCHSHLWFEKTFWDILSPGGIMVCHDIMNREGYPGLYDIVISCQQSNIRYVIFDKNSRDDERCERGLLVIFKD
jgi:predicted O-methyltransferase YrrM